MAVKGLHTGVILFLGLLVTVGRSCTYTSTADTGGDQSLWIIHSMVNDLAECEATCTADTECLSVELLSDKTCFRFQTATMATPRTNSIYSVKDCSAPCTMARTSSTKGGVTNIQLTLGTLEECGSACLYLSQCMGVTFSGGTCSIYGETISAVNTGDTMHKVKYPCPFTGKTCCMEDTTTMKANAAAVATLTASLESCEQLCLLTSTCVSVYFKNSVCYLYTASTTTSADAGSTYSLKNCTGTPTTSGDLTTLCVGSGADVPIVTSRLGTVLLIVIAAIN
ncbi:uncharacterized protein LOC124270625 [Haliotis rubra]|uniref:uncharacterized protein LOC124270625 n=1 Tax=Haliotis rubra TaxID=36100 RepID=UPI001EE5ADD3|nr:uncharacterized protein LOC124270625 [Haliotis rubra]